MLDPSSHSSDYEEYYLLGCNVGDLVPNNIVLYPRRQNSSILNQVVSM
jgi:hypothetical protein